MGAEIGVWGTKLHEALEFYTSTDNARINCAKNLQRIDVPPVHQTGPRHALADALGTQHGIVEFLTAVAAQDDRGCLAETCLGCALVI